MRELIYAIAVAVVAVAAWSTLAAYLGFCDAAVRQQDHEDTLD